jgi:hypothetical protein
MSGQKYMGNIGVWLTGLVTYLKTKLLNHRATLLALTLVASFTLMSCSSSGVRKAAPAPGSQVSLAPRLSEVAAPPVFQELRQELDTHQPQVKILSPRPDDVVKDTTVQVRLQVNDLELFKNEDLGLGPHLHFFLDNEPYRAIYSTREPVTLEDLTPGSHTIRVFASRPWHESFKNEGAYAQVTFHVFTPTPDNQPASDQPLLTYSRPQGSYGAEPIMLDFYLRNTPLHLIAQEDPTDDIRDWKIRCTVNGESFVFDRWEPIYLKGFKRGQNWVKLELLDENDDLFPNPYNSVVRLITYEPGGQDALSRLVRGEFAAKTARGIVDRNYVPEPDVIPEPEPEPTPEPSPVLPPEEPLPEIVPSVEPAPTEAPSPVTPEPVSPDSATETPSEERPAPEAAELESESSPENEPAPEEEAPNDAKPAIAEPQSEDQSDTAEPERPQGFLERARNRARRGSPKSSTPVPSIEPTPVPEEVGEASQTTESQLDAQPEPLEQEQSQPQDLEELPPDVLPEANTTDETASESSDISEQSAASDTTPATAKTDDTLQDHARNFFNRVRNQVRKQVREQESDRNQPSPPASPLPAAESSENLPEATQPLPESAPVLTDEKE